MISAYIDQESCPALSMQSFNTAANFMPQILLYLIIEFSFGSVFFFNMQAFCQQT